MARSGLKNPKTAMRDYYMGALAKKQESKL
jgi:hypothetical protein